MHESERGWSRPEVLLTGFVLVQYLSAGLLFLPGTQAVRPVIRALPYVSALMLWAFAAVWFPGRAARSPAAFWLALSLALLGVGFFLPDANPLCGAAQFVFQLSIAAPLFLMARLPCDQKLLDRLLVLVGVLNGFSALLGVGQVFHPDQFQPPEFTSLGLQLDPILLQSMTFTGPDGRQIMRPCGLSDQPGGAALGGAVAALFGLMLAMRPGLSVFGRAVFGCLAGVGILCLYLTQVRSLFLMALFACAVMVVFLFKQGRPRAAVVLLGGGVVLVVGMFALATQIGGDSVFDRFFGLLETGVTDSYRRNRGHFLEYTLTDLLERFPWGAGAGRHGMMYVYFAPLDGTPTPNVYVEIQLTAWLVDGGLPLMVCYSVALGAALWALYHLADDRRRPALAYSAAIVFCFDLFLVGQSFAAPCFNTSLGVQFWFLNGLVFAVARSRVGARGPAARRAGTRPRPAPVLTA